MGLATLISLWCTHQCAAVIPQESSSILTPTSCSPSPLYFRRLFDGTGGVSERNRDASPTPSSDSFGAVWHGCHCATIFFGSLWSSVADTAAIGSVMIRLWRVGGIRGFQHGVCRMAGWHPHPPCITMHHLRNALRHSVGQLFVAGFLPGLLMERDAVISYVLARIRNFPVERSFSARDCSPPRKALSYPSLCR